MSQIFDTEKFILEIESRRAIWDLSSDEYSNRDLKKKQWEEMVELFGGEGLPDEGKKELGQRLQRKWKNTRSCFSREERRMKHTKSGSAASHRTPYVYYNQLLFLKNNIGNLNTESSITEATEQEPLTVENEPLGPYTRDNTIGRKKKRTVDDGTRELLETLNKCVDTRKEKENDEDRMFLLSLLSAFKSIPNYKKAAAKIELLRVIETFTASTPQYTSSSFMNYGGCESEIRGYYSAQGPSTSTAPSLQSRSCVPSSESQISVQSVPEDSEYIDLF